MMKKTEKHMWYYWNQRHSNSQNKRNFKGDILIDLVS